jgi:lipopolysaccharide export system permease protein
LVGIFIDDRRDPNERVTSLAEYGEIIETGRGTFLVLIDGSVQRLESGKIDPTIVKFERYAFDLSRFNMGPRLGALGVRERNLWDVAFPDTDDPTYKQVPTHFRAELHDRLAAPLYPIAFTVLCFAILGAPRTSRQSREISIIMTVVIIGALRLIGFACNVVAAQSVIAVYVLWGSLGLTFGAGLYAIARGAVIEPPAFLTQLSNVFERMTRRLQPA